MQHHWGSLVVKSADHSYCTAPPNFEPLPLLSTWSLLPLLYLISGPKLIKTQAHELDRIATLTQFS